MYKQIAENKRNTVLIFLGFIILISLIGGGIAYLNDDPSIAITTTIIALVYAGVQYFFSTQLAIMMTGAKKANRRDNRRLYNIVENLTITAGLYYQRSRSKRLCYWSRSRSCYCCRYFWVN